jgi:hypothetical protein
VSQPLKPPPRQVFEAALKSTIGGKRFAVLSWEAAPGEYMACVLDDGLVVHMEYGNVSESRTFQNAEAKAFQLFGKSEGQEMRVPA